MTVSHSPAEALFLQGNEQLSVGRSSDAAACFRKALELDPWLAGAHTNLGLLCEQGGDPAAAEAHYRAALAINPASSRCNLNLGALLTTQKRFEEAETAYRTALELDPASPETWSNLGVLQACRKQETEAEQSYRSAITLDPSYRSAYFNLSYLLLRQGRFEEGWRCFEERDWYARFENAIPSPRWRGEPLAGRSLLIGVDGGHGDMIQFCRYLALLKGQGAARITLICHPGLKSLLRTMPCVDDIHAFDETFPDLEWDYWTPLMSLPYHCRTRMESIPAELPYLQADTALAAQWGGVISRECAPSDLRVGLVWKGSVQFENDADRSIPHLELLTPLGAVTGVRFFSLQKGAGEDQAAAPPAGLPLVDLGPQIRDFADSAAIVANLHLVISVDTAIAHLAGALGRECWLLLPEYKTDWRWLKERRDSPWYPRVMRLFRQSRRGEWPEVVENVRRALAEAAAGAGPLRLP